MQINPMSQVKLACEIERLESLRPAQVAAVTVLSELRRLVPVRAWYSLEFLSCTALASVWMSMP